MIIENLDVEIESKLIGFQSPFKPLLIIQTLLISSLSRYNCEYNDVIKSELILYLKCQQVLFQYTTKNVNLIKITFCFVCFKDLA